MNQQNYVSTNRLINFQFDNTTASALFYINIPFLVKEVIVKQIVYQDSFDYIDLNSYGALYTDLVEQRFLSIVQTSSTTGAGHQATYLNNRFIYKTPMNVNGNYIFELKNILGAKFPFDSLSVHQLGLVLEFIKDDSDLMIVS
jgi:hypothetical protein